MGHYACSFYSMKDHSSNIKATKNFQAVKENFSAQGISLERTSIANSGAIEQHSGLEESHVRPGLILYGPSSLMDSSQNPGKETSFQIWRQKFFRPLKSKKNPCRLRVYPMS